MTDEEKAENYAKGLCKTCTFDTCKHNALQTCAIKESLKQAYLNGLTEGRKEGYEQGKNNERITMWKENYEKDIAKLEKENEELKALIDQLSNNNHVLKTSFIVQQEQIEKRTRTINDIIEAFT